LGIREAEAGAFGEGKAKYEELLILTVEVRNVDGETIITNYQEIGLQGAKKRVATSGMRIISNVVLKTGVFEWSATKGVLEKKDIKLTSQRRKGVGETGVLTGGKELSKRCLSRQSMEKKTSYEAI